MPEFKPPSSVSHFLKFTKHFLLKRRKGKQMKTWIVVAFDNPDDDSFRTRIVDAETADEAVTTSGESYAMAFEPDCGSETAGAARALALARPSVAAKRMNMRA